MNCQNSPRGHFMKSIPNSYSHAKVVVVLFCTVAFLIITPTAQGVRRNPFFTSKSSHSLSSSSSSSKYYETEDNEQKTFLGRGRELNLFDNRGGDSTATSSSSFSNSGDALSSGQQQQQQQQPSSWPYKNTGHYNRKRKSIENYKQQRSNYYKSSSTRSSSSSSSKSILSSIKEWIQNGNLPKIQCRVEPNTTLKVRKTFRPLKTVVRLGADFNTQLGVWQFKSSWEDEVIGGKLTLAGRELQFSKTWLLSVGEYYALLYCMIILIWTTVLAGMNE